MFCSLAAVSAAHGSGPLHAEWRFPLEGVVLEAHELEQASETRLTSGLIVHDDDYEIHVTERTVTFWFESAGFWVQSPHNGWRFSGLDAPGREISGFELRAVGPGIASPDVLQTGFGEESVWVNLSGLSFEGADFLTFRIWRGDPCPGDITSNDGGVHLMGVPDDKTDLTDLMYYVEVWEAARMNPSAHFPYSPDVTTNATTPGGAQYGRPDGMVDSSDLLYFTNQWLLGRGACP